MDEPMTSLEVLAVQRDIFRLQLDDANHHLDHAHKKILQQREQLRMLNTVIIRRKFSMKRQRRWADAVKRLHRPVNISEDDTPHYICRECCCTPVGGNQSRQCADDHTGDCYPCRTLKAPTELFKQHVMESGTVGIAVAGE